MGSATALLIFLGLIAFGLLFFMVGIYNSLQAVKENVNKSWGNIDVILKQRYDEIPQLIRICEQYVQFEQGMINRIMSAREKMVQGKDLKEKSEASNALSQGVSGILAIGESNPQLKSNENFMQIQTRLSALEESLADRRELYNDSVNILNTRIQQIPDVFIAGIIGLQRRQLFEVSDFERRTPDLTIKFKR